MPKPAPGDDANPAPAPDDGSAFEPALAELNEVVQSLESGTLGLDEALGRYEQGVRLVALCRRLLETAERRVALLVDVDPEGRAVTQPFDATTPPLPESAGPSPTRSASAPAPAARPRTARRAVDPPF